MGEFLQQILQFIEFLWPLVRVEAHESGFFEVFGRVTIPWRWFAFSTKKLTTAHVGPGVYVKIPWFTNVTTCGIETGIANTGRIDIETKDGRSLTVSASARCRVIDPQKAMILLKDHERSMQEILAGVLSEKLAEVEPERLEPNKRARLNTTIYNEIAKEAEEFGIEISWIKFTTFIRNPKMIRLLDEPKFQMGTW